MADISTKQRKWTWKLPLIEDKFALYTLDWIPDPKKAEDPNGPENQLQMLLLGKDVYKHESDSNEYYRIGGLLLFPHGKEFLRVGVFWIGRYCSKEEEFFDDVEYQTVTII
jgi:hypothetical protein